MLDLFCSIPVFATQAAIAPVKYVSLESLVDAFRALVSLALLAASLFIIISGRYRERERNWAFTTVGALIGFWFRGLS